MVNKNQKTSVKRGKAWLQANPTDPSFSPETSPFFHLSRLVGLYHLRMDAHLKPIGMDVPRWRVINILHEHECATISKIADLAVIRVSTMTKLVYRMEREGLVVTSIAPHDGRVTEVRLTEKGRNSLDQVRAKAGLIFERAFHDIDDADLQALMTLTRRIYDNIY
ncbi:MULTISPECIES: MarR family winged helix-turn-helix transcriptional regulator [Nguyenibacter]|uniref:MarR family transcriptional regulator n=1 Tax=Nguyenibacter vanlangensis TaxID=1216886 RepID=A0A7Y7IUQ3_9PROT|nr:MULTISPECIES: MarR family transcriptional regulator [Nguyenibacter]NVN10497.1 MarR family transcriptional regulator [Nguyenibacter vanlangensis]WRH89306.1 MarR family transcriptional regulator [Nguyenibacter sp. L1]